MGLTIHYRLNIAFTAAAAVRELVDSLRHFARDLPFQKVGELLEFEGRDADYQTSARNDQNRWFKIQAARHIEGAAGRHSVAPVHAIGFTTVPGEGCEPANFGFCRYPDSIEIPGTASSRKRRRPTGLVGWSWGSFCKTQYASDPAAGGVTNFLRCHLSVVKLLDFMAHTGLITVQVSDEGGYWEHRDLGRLAREVGEWNEFIAAFAGKLKDEAAKTGTVLESAITGFANFEHLEAKGLERLKGLRGYTRDRSAD